MHFYYTQTGFPLKAGPHITPDGRRRPPVGTFGHQIDYIVNGPRTEPLPRNFEKRLAASIAERPAWWGRVFSHAHSSYSDSSGGGDDAQ